MITAKQAANQAAEFLKEQVPWATDIQLEEVELEDKKCFYITLGFNRKSVLNQAGVDVGRGWNPERDHYKRFKVDRKSGEVVSMTKRIFARG